eukprot:scaffold4419_cov31-Tisochrysis_lutea.AAC.7
MAAAAKRAGLCSDSADRVASHDSLTASCLEVNAISSRLSHGRPPGRLRVGGSSCARRGRLASSLSVSA